MNTLPVVISAINTLPGQLRQAFERAAEYAKQSKSRGTQKCYSADWKRFTRWCASNNLTSLPASPATVACFLADEAAAGLKPSTVNRRAAAIRYHHRGDGFESPTGNEKVRETMAGIRRTHGARPKGKAPAVAEIVKDMARALPPGVAGLRDRALLLLGFSGAFRRSELVALDVSDIEWTPEGCRVTVRRSKGDQEGHGQQVAIVKGTVACPVTALRQWLDAAGIIDGPIFRRILRGGHVTPQRLGAESVRLLVKRHATRIGLDGREFGAHSLRSGLATSWARAKAPLTKIMEITRHKDTSVLINSYIRPIALFEDHAAQGLL
jgi:site-specific recombinase XerD